ncbi:MAG TPA: hypothetical protein VJB99_02865 [Patescibacteria group bacterium]|nr:hypothetical protein [Patescibacteria group bacterium]
MKTLLKSSSFFPVCFGVSFLFLFFTTILPLLRLRPYLLVNQSIPLHYNVFLGVDRFGPAIEALFLPLFGAVILLADMFVAIRLVQREPFAARAAALFSVLVNAVLLVAMGFLVLLNL